MVQCPDASETKSCYKSISEISIDKNGKVAEKAKWDGTVQHVLVPEEERVKGRIGKGTFLKYLRSAGDGLVFFVAILLISAQIVSFGAEFTLKQWTESSASRDNTNYLVVFIALTSVAVIFGFLRALLFFHASLKASTSIHNKAFSSVIYSPLTFFVQNPLR